MAAGSVPEVPQDEALATYAPRLTKEDGVIDWRRPARAIHDQVRALHPWPHAFTFGPGGRLILHRSAADETTLTPEPPGTILPSSVEAIRVATGRGVLHVLELQAEGGKVLPARSFLAGHPLAVGARLGGR
jgi:methionyl-tRNA formyltransferase